MKMLMRASRASCDRLLHRLVHVAQRPHADALEDLDRHLLVGAGEPDDDRHLDLELAGGGDDAVGDVVGAGDAAEDVEEDRLHVRIGGDDLERVDDLLRVRAAADVEEVGRLAAVVLHQVHRRHREAGAVHHAADVAVELDEREVGACAPPPRSAPRPISSRSTPRSGRRSSSLSSMTILASSASTSPVGRGDQRIDLGERAPLFMNAV